MLRNKIQALIILCVVLTPFLGFSQDTSNATLPVTTWVLDDFDDHTKTSVLNAYNGGRHDVTWDVKGSIYITQTDEKPYPQKAYLLGFPQILPKIQQKEVEAMRMFAVRAAFNSKGYNLIELYPNDANTSLKDREGNLRQGVFFFEQIHQIGMYALGILRDYNLYAVFETNRGEMLEVYLGNLNYEGWKALVVEVPLDKYISRGAPLNSEFIVRLEKIIIETTPEEDVSDFVIYIDNIFYTLPVLNNNYYDGYEISQPTFKFNLQQKEPGKDNIQWESGSELNNQ